MGKIGDILKYEQKMKLSPKAVEIVKKIEKYLKVVAKDLSISPPEVEIYAGTTRGLEAEGYKTRNIIHLRERNLYGWGWLHQLVNHEFGHYISIEMSDSEIIDKITGYGFKESEWKSIYGGQTEQRADWIGKALMKKYLDKWNKIVGT